MLSMGRGEAAERRFGLEAEEAVRRSCDAHRLENECPRKEKLMLQFQCDWRFSPEAVSRACQHPCLEQEDKETVQRFG